jgi:hypothetical protein
LKALDNLIRKIMNGAIDIKGLQKTFYYTKTRDDVLGLTNLYD